MKRLLVSIFVLCGLSIAANAQTTGKLWVGGNFSFQTTKNDDVDRTYSYSFLPEVG